MTKFFGYEIGAQSKWDDHRKVGFVNGVHDTNDLQELVFKYIELLIMCPSESCQRPEIRYLKSGKNIRTCFFFFPVLSQLPQPFFCGLWTNNFFCQVLFFQRNCQARANKNSGGKVFETTSQPSFISLSLYCCFFSSVSMPCSFP